MITVTVSTGIDPPKHGYVLTVYNPGKGSGTFVQFHQVSGDLRNCANVPEPTMVKTFVKGDEPGKEK